MKRRVCPNVPPFKGGQGGFAFGQTIQAPADTAISNLAQKKIDAQHQWKSWNLVQLAEAIDKKQIPPVPSVVRLGSCSFKYLALQHF